MERLEERIEVAKKALDVFQEALQLPFSKIVRDASIQRFEFTFEAVWKLIQLYLRVKEGLEVNSPKGVFRSCFQVGLIKTEQDTALALQMAEERNLTVHTYNEKLAEQIFSHLPKYHELMFNIVKKIMEKVG
jgi:nucleotidyltransferase substrate binding protein (TIGR01987 family)